MQPTTAAATAAVIAMLVAFTSSRLPGILKNLIIPCSGRITKPHTAMRASIRPSTSSR